MAISHVHPMFLLILSLVFLPTLLAIPFRDCGRRESYPVKVTAVETNEAGFNITGSTIKHGLVAIMNLRYDLSELITFPVSPGAFVLPFHPPVPSLGALNYNVDINLFEDPEDDEIMCLMFEYKTSSTGVGYA
ncbi:hypothetical protein YC2023_038594 [Brassica napus]